MIAIHKDRRTKWTVFYNTGEAYRGLDGLSGSFYVPTGWYEIYYSNKCDKGIWSETHGISPEQFEKLFTLVDPDHNATAGLQNDP